ncbi:uncharacterized protein [Centruroides vittatus]|uniref:uncharacterized protein n=1 Tax=Centruroides vittatus TaxID=120091 RepID=UPI00350F75F1
MLYGTSLRLPGEFFVPGSQDVNPCSFVEKLRTMMANLKPVPVVHHSYRNPFIHKELQSCSHVFLRNDAVRKPLQPPYDGPYEVVSRGSKTFTLCIKGKETVVSIDRLKPAFLLAASESDQLPPTSPMLRPAPTRVDVPVLASAVPVLAKKQI